MQQLAKNAEYGTASWHGWVQAGVAFLFLFSGFYKNFIPFPVDFTVVTCLLALIVICLGSYSRRLPKAIARRVVVWVLVGLITWCGLRLVPEFHSWGVRKLMETVVFGGTAALLGASIAVSREARHSFKTLASWLVYPVATFLVFKSFTQDTYFGTLGGGGYQLTGIFLSFLAAASASARNLTATVIAYCAILLTANIGGALFGAVAITVVFFYERQWRLLSLAALGVLLVVGGYTAVRGEPPLSMQRALIQASGLLSIIGLDPAAQALIGNPVEVIPPNVAEYSAPEATSETDMSAIAVESAGARVAIWLCAVEAISQNWLVGGGYGNLIYDFSPMAHNVFLEIFAETGVVGFLLLLTLFVFWARDATTSSLALGLAVLVMIDMMFSAVWGGRISFFALGFAVGSAHRNTIEFDLEREPNRSY